jgi:hypothetical protein
VSTYCRICMAWTCLRGGTFFIGKKFIFDAHLRNNAIFYCYN